MVIASILHKKTNNMNYKEQRPWGEFEIIHQRPGLTIKIIKVNPNSRLSLQSHQKRDEAWLLLEGELEYQIEIVKKIMTDRCLYYIPRGMKHRLSADKKGGRVLEISYGEFDEKDIVRYEDDYGRTKSPYKA
jgi:mannose-6-phosphate isomerase-like protein (cupin superfamily)